MFVFGARASREVILRVAWEKWYWEWCGSKADSGGGGGFMSGVFSAVGSTFFSVSLLGAIFQLSSPVVPGVLPANQKASAALLANQRQGQIISKPSHQALAYQLRDSNVYWQQAQVKDHGSQTTQGSYVRGQASLSWWVRSHVSSTKEQGLTLV